jgi:hypothetical protein
MRRPPCIFVFFASLEKLIFIFILKTPKSQKPKLIKLYAKVCK